MAFQIRTEDWPLIRAAVQLGHWLTSLPEISEAQRDAIRRLQAVLVLLPEATTGVSGDYSFDVETEVLLPGQLQGAFAPRTSQTWFVSYHDARKNDGEIVLEIGNIFNPYPNPDADWRESLIAGHEWECHFCLRAGESANQSVHLHQQWIDQVASLEQFLSANYVTSVEASFQCWSSGSMEH